MSGTLAFALCWVVEDMSSDEIAEAERLVAAWEPNPIECEIEGAQAEN